MNDQPTFRPEPTEYIGPELSGILIVRVKGLRRDLDEHLQEIRSLPRSRENALALTKLQEAVMWLGMDLKRLGTPDPYPNSRDTTNTVVDPTADGLRL